MDTLASRQVDHDLTSARAATLALVAPLTSADLERVLHPLMSPLVWDLAHIAAYEDLWLGHRHGGLDLLHPELAGLYDAFETPRAVRGDLPLLGVAGALAYLEAVRERSEAVLAERGAGDGTLLELVLRHELQHTETMRQALALGGLLAPGEPPAAGPGDEEPGDPWVAVDAGPAAIGAGPEGFAYDNERPAHVVELPAFSIARRPVTNASWLRFAEGGGYERRPWWSAEGWAWKEEHDISDHAGARAGDPHEPVMCLSWYEADAFARSAGARLPTEFEWERACRTGLLEGTGQVWEWTSSPFAAYPGFRPHPYPEYSVPFFAGTSGPSHRVLRGGSWATHPRVASPTFRNWDLPQRRQLFAGLRLAAGEVTR